MMMRVGGLLIGCGLAMVAGLAGNVAHAASDRGLEGVPHYDNIVVVMMENRQFGQIIDASPATSPHMTALSHRFNVATQYYGISHVSQTNYIALTAGDQQNIIDDDPWYCEPDGQPLPRDKAIVGGAPDEQDMGTLCAGHTRKDTPYPAHHFTVPNFFAQLDQAGISWSMYVQSVPLDPKTGRTMPEVPYYPTKAMAPELYALYAVKHNPSMNMDDIRSRPDIFARNQTDTAFFAQARAGTLPRFSYVIPDQCHDDHGPYGSLANAPQCRSNGSGPSGLLTSGDNYVQSVVDAVMASPVWSSRKNVAIVVTYDEDDYGSAGIQGCCGFHPADLAKGRVGPVNQGGGRVPTIVITNHGVKGVRDDTPYNHYSLLRTMEDAFGIGTYVGHAAERVPVQPEDGSFVQTPVLPMVPLFRLAR
ncbi:hypothetical protein KGY14_13695 [Ameyamaea chiangmaiensis]|uniref:Phosphoesterase n=1 Tax=Ameyamaea chiangmaiensis TaxID=442969 RepID=A0A850PAY3_9PROT|nr:alkaline phosphatase family protein [Ameyamaea chiangmaiensis]MBS4076243.1 hypothetical protein [Ameyamaea chiangmaiensis]NVN39700.1 hypothetical protein [Ameyamaea chiangmaiensis]